MKEDSVNNKKMRVKKVSRTSRGDNQKTPLEAPNEAWEQVKKDPKFQELVQYLTREDSWKKELEMGKEEFLKQKPGRPRKDPVFFMQKLARLIGCLDDELFFQYRDILFENLKHRIRELEKFDEDMLKNVLKEWSRDSIVFLLGEECNVDININELENELFNEIEKMDEKTLKENFYKLIVGTDPTREAQYLTGDNNFERLRRAGKAGSQEGFNREKGEIAEVIMYSQLLKICEKERSNCEVIPYFKKDKPQEKKKKNIKRGRKRKGHYYADIAVIDLDTKVVGIIELKNWMSTGVYRWEDYQKHDWNKWEKTKKDVQKVLKWLAGERVKRDSPGVASLKKDIRLLEAIREEGVINGVSEETIKKRVDWKLLYSSAIKVSEDSEEINNDIKWIRYELSKPIHLHREIKKHPELKPDEFKIVNFWVMFVGRLVDDGNGNKKLEGVRLLDPKIRRDFVNRGVVEVYVWPALFIDQRESWEVGTFIARAILGIMRTGSVAEANLDEHVTIDEDNEHEDVKIIKIQWKTLPYRCTIKIPKRLRWKI
ncbi:hypothetical protein [Thermococcus sp.]|uniref:hypothetical protein n=1 Tax=Thermococcus sp. TaxID=35749 RepID=UPI0026063564|nr:hypothetical protein [Thermococcus sp.]